MASTSPQRKRAVEIQARLAKITPWPWEVAQYTNHIGYSIWANGAGCIAERWYPSEHEDVPIEANARFIAAAPDDIDFLLKRAIVAEGLLRDAQEELAKAAAVAATPQSFDLEGCRHDFNQLYLRIRSFLSAEGE